jgi:NhaP-type Na+/H+ or K+/H+ antiporter
MIGNKVLRIIFGIATGVFLGFLNYRLMAKSITSTADLTAIRKSSLLRLLFIFLGLYCAIRLGGVLGLCSAAIVMLALTWAGLIRIAKRLAGGGEEIEQ